MADRGRAEVSLYRRNARHVTHRRVLHDIEKENVVADKPFLRRRSARQELERDWAEEERIAAEEVKPSLRRLRDAALELDAALRRLALVESADLRGKVDPEIQRVEAIVADLDEAAAALDRRDFGAAGAAADRAGRELWLAGGPLVVVLNEALGRAAIGRAQRDALRENVAKRRSAKQGLEQARLAGPAAAIDAAAAVHRVEALGLQLAAEILSVQTPPKRRSCRSRRRPSDPCAAAGPARPSCRRTSSRRSTTSRVSTR